MNRCSIGLMVGILLLMTACGAAQQAPAPAEQPPAAQVPSETTGAEPAGATAARGSAPTPPQESPPAKRLPEVVVTASRMAEPGFDAPYSLHIITEDKIRDESYRTPTDAL
ncbi:MAG TPA: hypothetical protein VMY69_07735, partial [Phycisphaerae bacterium]|nr:hypothetical protein [Phycisphaerae bacterium]